MEKTRILHGKIILAAGDFGQKTSHGAMREWVERASGTWLTEFNDSLTHLVTTREEWEKQTTIGLLDIGSHVFVQKLTRR
jgi:hypothetical protein